MKTIPAFLMITFFLLISIPAFSMQGSSDTKPANFVRCSGKTQVNYNIHQVNGIWKYEYVEITGKVTKAKIKEALLLAKNKNQEVDIAEIEAELSQAEEKLAQISQLSYSQIDTYVDNTFSNLSDVQRTSLKKLYKCVLALIKELDLE